MPNDEETRHTVRVPEDEWRQAKAAVALAGTSISEVVRVALREYVAKAELRLGWYDADTGFYNPNQDGD